MAQTNRGSIAGTVFDPPGAAVPGATVKVTNLGTNQAMVLTASSEGRFAADLLEPVTYRVEVEARGFKTCVIEAVRVDMSSVATANVTMQRGEVSTQVTVAAEAGIVNAESGTVGPAITERQIMEARQPSSPD